MLSVMYHYVQEANRDLPYFRYLDFDNFKKQLDYFSENYLFTTREEWDQLISGNSIENYEKKIILTFDDSLSCHYDYVSKELKKRDLWGIFYVPVLPYLNNKMLDVHRVHLLSGFVPGNDLLKNCLEIIPTEKLIYAMNDDFKEKTYVSQNNYDGVSNFKRILNYFVSDDYKTEILDILIKRYSLNDSATSYYISEKKLKQMSDAGMIIGSHTLSHPVMSKLTKENQKREIEESFNFLSNFLNLDHKTYCHPHGGFHSFNVDTIEILKELKVDYAFNVESRQIESGDFINSRFHLPRFNTNEFPHGKAN